MQSALAFFSSTTHPLQARCHNGLLRLHCAETTSLERTAWLVVRTERCKIGLTVSVRVDETLADGELVLHDSQQALLKVPHGHPVEVEPFPAEIGASAALVTRSANRKQVS